jgi:hypothetical protein
MSIATIVLLLLALLINTFVVNGIRSDKGVHPDSRRVINIFVTANSVLLLVSLVLVAVN